MEGVNGQAKAGGQVIPDVTGKDLWKTETGELLRKGLKVADMETVSHVLTMRYIKHKALLVCIVTALQTTLS